VVFTEFHYIEKVYKHFNVMKQNLQRSANPIGLSQPNTERQPIYKPKQPEVTSEQAEFAKYACAFADDEYVCRIADNIDKPNSS
jgi:hypothetical protein